jgi:hypothetical protein
MTPVQSLPAGAGTFGSSTVLVVLLFLLVAGHVLVSYGRRLPTLALLAGLVVLFVGQQLAFTAVVAA